VVRIDADAPLHVDIIQGSLKPAVNIKIVNITVSVTYLMRGCTVSIVAFP
jgi:hypothetical protein